MRTSLKQLCEAAKKRNTWKLTFGDRCIRNSDWECPIVAGYAVLTGNDVDSDDNCIADELAEEIGLTVDSGDIMSAADDPPFALSRSRKALHTRMLRYLGIEGD